MSNEPKKVVFNLRIGSLFKDSIQVLSLRILGMVLAYGAMVLISNLYGAEVFGRYSLSLTILQFLILFSSFGITISVVKLTADVNNFKDNIPLNQYLKKSVVLLLFSAFSTSLLIYFTKDYFATVVFNDAELRTYFKWMSLFFGTSLIFSFLVEFIRGRQKFRLFGLFMYVIPNVFLIGFIFFFSKLNFDSSYSFYSYLLGLASVALMLLAFFPLKNFNKKTTYFSYANLLRLSLPMMFSTAFVFIVNWTDVFMLGAMTTKQELGIYNAAYKISIVVLIVINAFNTVLAPKIAKYYGSGELMNIKNEIQRATKLITIFSIPILMVLLLFRKQLLQLFGPEFVEGEVVLVTFSLSLLFNAMSGSVGLVLNMTSYQKAFRNMTIFCAALNGLLNYFLIREYGITGAAYASTIASIILNIIGVLYVKRKFGFYTFKWQ